jgi:adenosylcobinamide-GDP ribazoletransferase
MKGQFLHKDDLVAAKDIAAALGLLSRLPVPLDTAAATARGARAAWAFPVAGLFLGIGAASAGAVALWLGLPPALAAVVVVAVQVTLTGAMHEDGLSDSADGLWGGWDRARRLAIMKDSRTGTYGVIALVLSLLVRWVALWTLIGAGWLWPAVIATACISRAPMVALMAALPHARDGGLSRSVGRPSRDTALLALGVAILVAVILLGSWTFVLVLTTGATSLGWAAIAKAKIGGQTGDILGATQQICEIVTLMTLVALLG